MLKISVVIPTYQRCKSLERALTALSAQTLPPGELEIIVSIDGSDDGTLEMVKDFSSPYHIRYIWEPNSGRAVACNKGIREARGEVVIFLDDDMEPLPDFAKEHYNSHATNAKVGVIGAAPIVIGEHSPPAARYIAEGFNAFLENYLSNPDNKISLSDFYGGSFSIRREFLLQSGLFNESFKLYGYEDAELIHRLINNGLKLIYNPSAVALQHYENDFKTVASNKISSGRMAVLLVRIHPDTFNELKLREYNQAGWKWRVTRLLLIKCGLIIPKTNDIIISLISLAERHKSRYLLKLYDLSIDYFFWYGVVSETKKNGHHNLLSKIKSCRWRPT